MLNIKRNLAKFSKNHYFEIHGYTMQKRIMKLNHDIAFVSVSVHMLKYADYMSASISRYVVVDMKFIMKYLTEEEKQE